MLRKDRLKAASNEEIMDYSCIERMVKEIGSGTSTKGIVGNSRILTHFMALLKLRRTWAT
jgi:hypothetical protein